MSGRTMRVDIGQMLRHMPEYEHVRMFSLTKDGPAIVEELTGKRPHKSALHRWATRKPIAPHLQCLKVPGIGRVTCRAWLLNYFEALRLSGEKPAEPKKTARRRAAKKAGGCNA